MQTMYRMMIAATLLAAPIAVVQAGGHDGGKGSQCHRKCPHCDHACEFSVEKEDVTHHCYGSECKPICIPKITLPWGLGFGLRGGCDAKGSPHQKGGKDGCCHANPGAHRKSVHVLKKYEYTCQKCKCKFTVYGKGGAKAGNNKDLAPPTTGEGDVPLPEPPALDARILYGKPVVEQATYTR